MLKRAFALVVLLSLFAVLWALIYACLPLQKVDDQSRWHWYIAPHTTLSFQVRQPIWQQHVAHPSWFAFWMRLLGQDQTIRPGEYVIDAHTTPFALMQALRTGQVVRHNITLLEGSSWRDLSAQLTALPRYGDYGQSLSEKSILEALKSPYGSLEGLLFPSTYHWEWLTPNQVAYAQAYQLMQQHLEQIWQDRDEKLPYQNPYQLLIAASLIEREVSVPSERAKVGAVIVNRLRKKMRLQIDASVLYGLGRTSGRVHYKDLKKDTPYNTYLHAGLPPTPIALPSKASLIAAGHPESSDVLYYVLCDDAGHHCFSSTWAAHQRAIRLVRAKGR